MKLHVKLVLLLAGLSLGPGAAGQQVVHAAPSGTAEGDGSQETPVSLLRAVELVKPGDRIILAGGEYLLPRRIEIYRSGEPGRPIRMEAAPGATPVLDGRNIAEGGEWSRSVVSLKADYWHFTGIHFVNGWSGGVTLSGSHNRFDRCVAHHNGGTGFNVAIGHRKEVNPDGEKGAYNEFYNCDSYMNFDWWTVGGEKRRPGTNADGFACKLSSGKGNKFYGCRAWSNSDDGWDLFESAFGVVIVNCWAWDTGIWSDYAEMYRQHTGEELTEELFDGNGNGFKLGGNHNTGGTACGNLSSGMNVLRNSIAFGNAVRGIDQNNHGDGVLVEHCLSFDNGTNIGFWRAPNPGKLFVFRNNIVFGKGGSEPRISVPYVSEGNSWDLGLKGSADQFESLAREDAMAPRGEDGSLPVRFGRLVKCSVFIDRGVPTGPVESAKDAMSLPAVPFTGNAPDLGAYER